ncbi:MAG: ELM1/GtrOC1 family putative glycosyltransferase, partial [Geminicoccales bacterium]
MAADERADPRFRIDPEKVVLEVRPGVTPNGKPPVRIFLGTEDAQHRAERVFFYSIEKHRDPARVYEVHRMKNLAGFKRKGWRTGFTNYRFGIPDFAGRRGKAIYNDVDQIYLTDPAELFDLGLEGHGYLAISPKDTSVMLIDCARMAELWNRETATSAGKARLTNQPAATPGLWGPLDPGWNARDVEYVEGESKVLHYTALHQQPWQPFPKEYSYHPNPLAYLWHDLEREADARRYQVFNRSAPSAGFAEAIGAGARINREQGPPGRLSSRAVEMIAGSRADRVLEVGLGKLATPVEVGQLLEKASFQRLDLADPAHRWPDQPAGAVLATNLLDHVPGEDLPWLLDELFSRARSWIYLAVAAEPPTLNAEQGGDAHCGRRTADWWRTRIAEAANRWPRVSWHLDVGEAPALEPVASFQTRRIRHRKTPRVWALTDPRPAASAPVLRLAEALGWPFEVKQLAFNALFACPNVLLGGSLASLDRRASSPLDPPWPDLAIGWGRRSVPVARWIREQSGGRTRLVQLGRPRAPFDAFDLIVTSPQYRLPIRPNVQHNAAPLAAIDPPALARARGEWQERLSNLPRPFIALLVPAGHGAHALDPSSAARLGRESGAMAAKQRGSLLVAVEPDVPREVADALQAALDCPQDDFGMEQPVAPQGRAAALALADAVIVAGDDPQALAVACQTGKQVLVYRLPGWRERIPALDRLQGLLPKPLRMTYRGTPFQQTAAGRMADRLVESGLVAGGRNPSGVARALEARGLARDFAAKRAISS